MNYYLRANPLGIKVLSRLVSIFLLSVSVTAIAQRTDKPLIRTYSTKDFKAHAQNWCVESDQKGLVYFGNQEGVLEFDGYNWRAVHIPNQSTVRNMALADDGTLYIGAVGEFGFLKPDRAGRLTYESLLPLIDTSQQHFSDVWNVAYHQGKAWFLTDDFLFCFDGYTVSTYKSRGHYLYSLFKIGDELFLHDFGYGLTRFNGDSFTLLKGGEAFAETGIHSLTPVGHDLMVGMRDKGLFRLDTLRGVSKPINAALNKTLNDYNLYHSIALRDGNFALATIGRGVMIIDSAGHVIEEFLKDDGLSSINVYQIAEIGNQLWLACENGISVIDYYSPLRMYREQMGFSGNINDIAFFNEELYLASGTGVFWLNTSKSPAVFEPVKGLFGQGWDLELFVLPNGEKRLLCGASEGLFQLNKNKATLIRASESVFRVVPSSIYPYTVYLGTSSKISMVELNNQTKVSKYKRIKLFKYEVREIFEEPCGILWAGVTYEGLHKMNCSSIDQNGETTSTLYNQSNGFNFGRYVIIFGVDGQTVFSTETGMYTFDAKTETFSVYEFAQKWINAYPLDELYYVSQWQNQYWINARVHLTKENDRIISDTLKVRFLNDVQTYHQFIDSTGTFFVATEGIIYTITQSLNGFESVPFKTLIRSVQIANDSTLYFGHSDSIAVPRIEHHEKVIRFNFSASQYQFPEQLQYSYHLEGFDKDWSDWTPQSQKEFTNLSEGTYTFYVKSKDAFGREGSIASYKFTVLPPVYRTIWAYLGYFILLIGIINLLIFWRTKKLRRDRDRLNRIVAERTAEVTMQKEEIQASAENLRQANEELLKLSIIAQKTDNAVGIFDCNGNLEWVNDGFTRLYGYTFEEFVKLKGRNIVVHSLNPNIKEAVQRCIDTHETTLYEFFSLTKNMVGKWTLATLTPIVDDRGNLLKMIAIDSDITKLKEAELKIEHQRDELKKANDTKDKFFSIIAHDLRGPLSNIFTLLNILINDIDHIDIERLKKSLSLIRETTGNTFNLTENLLEWAHLRKNTIVCNPKALVVSDVILENIELFQSQANKKDIALLHEVNADVVAFADAEMVKTVLRNLLSNAIKFTPEHGSVTVSAKYCKTFVCVEVRDTGLGMTKDEVDKLFRLDIRHSTSGTNNEKGSGLGLILSKEFIERNGGTIKVESAKDQGSTFIFTLPKPR